MSLLSIKMKQLGFWQEEMFNLVILQKEFIFIINDAFCPCQKENLKAQLFLSKFYPSQLQYDFVNYRAREKSRIFVEL